MAESIYMNPLRPQPYDGGIGTRYSGIHEWVDYLPGTSVRIWYTSNQDSFDRHWHDAMEIVRCEQGEYESTSEHGSYRLDPGDILLMPGGTIHTLCPKNDCRGYVYLISLSLLSSIPSSVRLKPLLAKPLFLSHGDSSGMTQEIWSCLEKMNQIYFGQNSFRELGVYSVMLQILRILGQNKQRKIEDAPEGNDANRSEYTALFTEALRYIDTHYQEDIRLEDLAKEYGFSKFYFSRLFHQYSGYSFSKYLQMRRLQAAKGLLGTTNDPISHIAEEAGFQSLATFNRVFRQNVGCSPKEYRSLAAKAKD